MKMKMMIKLENTENIKSVNFYIIKGDYIYEN